ncbi:btb poz domain-containing [Fusarium albosuccineum]|uniref:Btb poz domain-containing n=1 Tax=Fusarium albosuccineum TaxID=1237068 RepID=A0A8H4LH57_9HYPO|nr:btb poz domain-containing [Fusarium albosuccineum]
MSPRQDIDIEEEGMKEHRKRLSEQPLTRSRLFHTGEYSDLRIICGNKTYAVHRAVVFYQCPLIKSNHAPCVSNWVGSSRTFGSQDTRPAYNFYDDDPQAVDCLVQYFYHWDYNVSSHTRDARAETGVIYKEDTDSSPSDVPLSSDLISHVRVFALAEKYSIHLLKSLSVAKFEAAAQQYGKTHYFADAAREAYNTALPDDIREIRDSIVKFIYKRQYLIQEDHIKKLMLDKPQLSLNLHLRYSIKPAPLGTWVETFGKI